MNFSVLILRGGGEILNLHRRFLIFSFMFSALLEHFFLLLDRDLHPFCGFGSSKSFIMRSRNHLTTKKLHTVAT